MAKEGRENYRAFVLKQGVMDALLRHLHEVEMERGRRITWDEAFRVLLERAGRPVIDG